MIRNIFNAVILALCVIFSIKALAQNRPADRDYDDRSTPGVSAGGNWTMDRSEDRITTEKRTRFQLQANDARDGDDRAQVFLYCSDGELKLADFRPNLRMSRPNWASFWGRPQMHVRVRADRWHDEKNWNWVNGHFLAMDKGTTRELIGAQVFRIEFNTPDGPRIAEFSPAGLELKLIRDACGLTPKRP